MSEEIVTYARKDGHLVALLSVTSRENEQAPPRFALAERRVTASANAGLRPGSVPAAWADLGDRLGDARAAASACTVLLETVPLGDAGSGASHDRAWICRPDAWARVRDAVRPRLGRVRDLLRAGGYEPRVEAALGARDPYAAYHHHAPEAPGLQALPARFRAFVLPSLRTQPWSAVKRALALYWSLGLAQDDALLAAAVRVLTASRAHGLDWLEWIGHEDPAQRPTMGVLLLQSSALACDPRGLPDTKTLLDGLDSERRADRVVYLLRGLAQGADPAHLIERIRISEHFAPWYRPGSHDHTRPARPALDAATQARLWLLFDHITRPGSGHFFRSFALDVWEWAVRAPAHASIVHRPSLLAWPPATTRALLHLLVYEDARGRTLAERLAIAERLLASVPASHQVRAVRLLIEVLERGPDAARLEAASRLIVRIARAPFRADEEYDPIVALLIGARDDLAERTIRLPERSLRALDRATTADQGGNPVRSGLASLADISRGFLVEALEAHPQPLLAAARLLGFLSAPHRRLVVKRFRAHPLCRRRFARRPLDEVCAAIEREVARGLPNPVPRKLREHREHGAALSTGSLERHRQTIVRRLLSLRIALLRRMALDAINRGIGVDLRVEGECHAVQLLRTAGPNRRLLRRVLRMAPASRRPFLEGHPRNQAWLARHAPARHWAWDGGLRLTVTFDSGDALRIGMERDPIEVLRMGTRVGSCLSAGGCNAHSAVCVMADANKRLLVARDDAGRFVARQLVALADDDALVCFPVYPQGCAGRVQDAFERLDRALADALGTPIAADACCQVADVLARDFYDDGTWARFAGDA